jgi:hypothetical protein
MRHYSVWIGGEDNCWIAAFCPTREWLSQNRRSPFRLTKTEAEKYLEYVRSRNPTYNYQVRGIEPYGVWNSQTNDWHDVPLKDIVRRHPEATYLSKEEALDYLSETKVEHLTLKAVPYEDRYYVWDKRFNRWTLAQMNEYWKDDFGLTREIAEAFCQSLQNKRKDYEVRQIDPEDNFKSIPIPTQKESVFSVWNKEENKWVSVIQDNSNKPTLLSKEDAEKWVRGNYPCNHSKYEVRQVDPETNTKSIPTHEQRDKERYSVWSKTWDKWTRNIWKEHWEDNFELTLAEAETFCHSLNQNGCNDYVVRQIDPEDDSKSIPLPTQKKPVFSVWNKEWNRWARLYNVDVDKMQEPSKPIQLSKEGAEKWAQEYNPSNHGKFEVRQIDPEDNTKSIPPSNIPIEAEPKEWWNVWFIHPDSGQYWTTSKYKEEGAHQLSYDPFHLSKNEAEEWSVLLNGKSDPRVRYEARRVDPNDPSKSITNDQESKMPEEKEEWWGIWIKKRQENGWTEFLYSMGEPYVGIGGSNSCPLKLTKREAENWFYSGGFSSKSYELRQLSEKDLLCAIPRQNQQSKPKSVKPEMSRPEKSRPTLNDCKIGSHVSVFVDKHGDVMQSHTEYGVMYETTIIGRKNHLTVLGWKEGDPIPTCVRPSLKTSTFDSIPNREDYMLSAIVDGNAPCTVISCNGLGALCVAKLGETIGVFLDTNNNVVEFQTTTIVKATVIGINRDGSIKLGWASSPNISNVSSIDERIWDGNAMIVENIDSFCWALDCPQTLICYTPTAFCPSSQIINEMMKQVEIHSQAKRKELKNLRTEVEHLMRYEESKTESKKTAGELSNGLTAVANKLMDGESEDEAEEPKIGVGLAGGLAAIAGALLVAASGKQSTENVRVASGVIESSVIEEVVETANSGA